MQLNYIIFPAPKCSYTTERLLKDVVYIPKPDQSVIPCLYLPYENETKLLLFFHGNAEDIGIAFDILTEIRNYLKVNGLAYFIDQYPCHGVPRLRP